MAWDDSYSDWDSDDEFYYPTDSEDCELCDAGLIKTEHVTKSQDNYCICQLGDERRELKRRELEKPRMSESERKRIAVMQGKPMYPKPEIIEKIICQLPGCGGAIIGKKEPDTHLSPGEWYAICEKCGGEYNED